MLVVLGVGVTVGCTSEQNGGLKPDSFVGVYIFRAADKGSTHDPDKLTLEANGKYVLVHMPGAHEGATEEGGWQLIDKPTPRIAFGNTVYPVEIKGREVRLLVNDDLGWSYEKTK
jgi:hypothetical protein